MSSPTGLREWVCPTEFYEVAREKQYGHKTKAIDKWNRKILCVAREAKKHGVGDCDGREEVWTYCQACVNHSLFAPLSYSGNLQSESSPNSRKFKTLLRRLRTRRFQRRLRKAARPHWFIGSLTICTKTPSPSVSRENFHTTVVLYPA